MAGQHPRFIKQEIEKFEEDKDAENKKVSESSEASVLDRSTSRKRKLQNTQQKLIAQGLKVTLHLQWCLSSKRCSGPGLNGSYLKPYIKLKLIELAI